MLLRPFLRGIFWGLLLTILALTAIFFRFDRPVDELKEKYAYPKSSFVDIQGMPVHVRSVGEGMPVVLLHGTGASLHTWEGWTQELRDSFRVISLDLPAFGLTGPHPSGDYSVSTYVSFLEAFAQKMQLDSFHLAGNSFGGLIAWNYAYAHPERVGKLILIDASGFPRNGPMPMAIQLARYPVVRDVLRYITPKILFRKSLQEVYGDPDNLKKKTINRYYELFLRTGNREAYIARARESYSVPTAPLRELSLPVMIQWGAKDSWISPENARQFDALIPNSRVIMYPELGHVPMEEDPVSTARDAKSFLLEE